MGKRRSFDKEIPAFVGVDGRGVFAWGTIRATRESCAEAIERFASPVAGYSPPLRIVPVWIGFDLNRQLAFELDDTPAQPIPSERP